MISLVTQISTEIRDSFRRIKVIVKGRNDARTPYEAMPFGVDGLAPIEWRAVMADTTERAKPVIIGYYNKIQLETLVAGENRLYSTDDQGALSTFIYLRGDGTMEIGGDADFMVRFGPLADAVNENKAKINEMVQKWNTFASAYVPGSPTVPGTPPTAQTAAESTADIDPAKIEEIKTI